MEDKKEYCIGLMTGFIPRINWLDEEERPTTEEVREWFNGCTTTRGGLRLIKRPRKDATETQRAVFERLRWHRCLPGGSSSLWGPMGSLMRTDARTYAAVDAFATMVSVLCGTYRHSGDHQWSALLNDGRKGGTE